MAVNSTTISVLHGHAVATNLWMPGTDFNAPYTIVGGPDASKMTIAPAPNGGAPELRFVTPPNVYQPHDEGRDNVFNVTVSTLVNGVKTDFDYNLKVIPDDHLGSTATTSTVTVNGDFVTGRIDLFEERDWFRFDTNGGGMLVTLQGATRYAIHDASGAFLQSADGGDPNVQYLTLAPGTYFLSVGGQEGATYRAALSESPGYNFATSGDDVRYGTGQADFIAGNLGNDTVVGYGGHDVLYGGLGNDSIDAGAGRDLVRGDDGNDTLIGGGGFDDMHGNMGDDVMSGGEDDDWVVGGQGSDTVHGDAGNDLVHGSRGDDICYGDDGADTLRGGQDNDFLYGGSGNDFLSGDRGDDTITGGSGADIFHTFVGAGIDRVLDFSAAEGDRVMLETPGVQYQASQVGADTVVAFADGYSKLILVGVQLASLGDGWIA